MTLTENMAFAMRDLMIMDPVLKRRLGELLDHYRMGISSS